MEVFPRSEVAKTVANLLITSFIENEFLVRFIVDGLSKCHVAQHDPLAR